MEMSEQAKEAKREYNRQWRKRNAEHVKEYRRKWRSENKDKDSLYNQRYWEKKSKEVSNQNKE